MTRTTARQSRIDGLRQLIAHPRTSENERKAAERMLKRALEAQGESASTFARSGSGYQLPEVVYGEKYDWKLSTKDIAALIRAEISLSRKLGKKKGAPGEIRLADLIADAPAQIRMTVRIDQSGWTPSIDIVVRDIPQDWGFETVVNRYHPRGQVMPTEALRNLAKALKGIMSDYNHDGTDSMVDHYDVRFYGHVCTTDGLLLA